MSCCNLTLCSGGRTFAGDLHLAGAGVDDVEEVDLVAVFALFDDDGALLELCQRQALEQVVLVPPDNGCKRRPLSLHLGATSSTSFHNHDSVREREEREKGEERELHAEDEPSAVPPCTPLSRRFNRDGERVSVK